MVFYRRSMVIAAVLLCAAAAVTIYSLLNAAAWQFDPRSVIFMTWAVSPFVCFFATVRIILKFAPIKEIALAASAISALLLVSTLYSYVGVARDQSPTNIQDFVLIPLYLYIVSFFMLSLSILISRFFIKKN